MPIEDLPTRFTFEQTMSTTGCGDPPSFSRYDFLRVFPGLRTTLQNPKWRSKVKAGIDATTPYSRSGYAVTNVTPANLVATSKCPPHIGGTTRIERGGLYCNVPFSLPSGSLTNVASNAAIMSFIKDVKSQSQHMSGGTFLGELNKTLSMIRNPAQALRRGLDDYLDDLKKGRGRSRTLKQSNQYIAGTWLEYSFGWVPLISDVIAGAEALARLIEGDNRHEKVRGYGESSEQLFNRTNYFSAYPFTGSKHETCEFKQKVIIRGAIKATAQGPTIQNAKQLFGFTPQEFVPTVWNLLPYSFLSDYFINIGDILEATFLDKTAIIWTCRSDVQESIFRSFGSNIQTITNFSGGGSIGDITIVRKTFSRSNTTPLVPTLEFTFPGEPQKWINMAALATKMSALTPYR